MLDGCWSWGMRTVYEAEGEELWEDGACFAEVGLKTESHDTGEDLAQELEWKLIQSEI